MKTPEIDKSKMSEVMELVEKAASIMEENADIIEADMDYWLKFLEVNTGLENLSDYIFYPDLVGMERSSSLEQIADRIIADRIITDK